jgi:hypothetical protein
VARKRTASSRSSASGSGFVQSIADFVVGIRQETTFFAIATLANLGCELAPLEAITQTHSDARPIVPDSIIPELRQQRSLQQNHIFH